MAKPSKRRAAELRYIVRSRMLRAKRKRKHGTPWKDFFARGVGAELLTEIAQTSIHSIVYSYGKRLGKVFKCSCTVDVDSKNSICVKLESVRDRHED